MDAQKKQKLLKGAVITGIINAIINGGIQYFFLKGNSSIPISVDSITNDSDGFRNCSYVGDHAFHDIDLGCLFWN